MELSDNQIKDYIIRLINLPPKHTNVTYSIRNDKVYYTCTFNIEGTTRSRHTNIEVSDIQKYFLCKNISII